MDLNLTQSTDRLACCCLQLSELEFEVVHRLAIKRQVADALPRLPTGGEDNTFKHFKTEYYQFYFEFISFCSALIATLGLLLLFSGNIASH